MKSVQKPEASDHTGTGLLSRFLGAAFLVLLTGLLLLDRALLGANQNQNVLDTQTAALLAEAFISNQAEVLGRVGDLASTMDTVRGRQQIDQRLAELTAHNAGSRFVWIHSSAGSTFSASKGPPLSPELIERLEHSSQSGGVEVQTVPVSDRRALIALTTRGTGNEAGYSTGIILDGNTLRDWLNRASAPSRIALEVIAGRDTIVSIGNPARAAEGLNTTVRLIRLPGGGTWIVSSTHALATRSLRAGLWTLGILGALFLAYGLLREQRRALQASERSTELERLYSDVKRANQAKSEFLANVSHELRTPLNAIVGFVELLREGFYGELSQRQVQPVDRIAASATHLRHLVDQVLDIAKIAAGRLEVHSETMLLRPFVLNVASELESLLSERRRAFSISIASSLPRVRTDPTHLRQILINLIGNAVKYSTDGAIGIKARLLSDAAARLPASTGEIPGEVMLGSAPGDGSWIALQVTDSGIGIAAADLERIFDEFEQVNAGPRGDSMNRGTGLGLPISRRLARLLGGDISVESSLGSGSTFTIWIPVNETDLASHIASANERRGLPLEDVSHAG